MNFISNKIKINSLDKCSHRLDLRLVARNDCSFTLNLRVVIFWWSCLIPEVRYNSFVIKKMVSLPLFQVDAFTDTRFRGNPAGICLICDDVQVDDVTLQQIAFEKNLSETAFLRPLPANLKSIEAESQMNENPLKAFPWLSASHIPFVTHSRFSLRWFTPTKEVSLCGHATLASATLLKAIGNNNPTISFETLSGTLVTTHTESNDQDGSGGIIEMLFPANQPTLVCIGEDIDKIGSLPGVDLPRILAAVLGNDFEKSSIRRLWISHATKKLVSLVRRSHCTTRTVTDCLLLQIVELSAFGAEPLLPLSPDFPQMISSHNGSVITGISVTTVDHQHAQLFGSSTPPSTTTTTDAFDIHSRYFAPWNGIPEDPVNGSSHTILTPLFTAELKKPNLRAHQASKRDGELFVSMQGDRVVLAGKAVLVSAGVIWL
jgi:predicted PhzF superfamily epimerase YddE/YHI9